MKLHIIGIINSISLFFQALLLQNYITGFSGFVSFGLLYFLRIQKEEAMMEEQFGEIYKVYKQKTKKLIPFTF